MRGIAAILFGILAWAWPGITLLALLILFGAYALVDGGFALAGSLLHRRVLKEWWLILLLGLASIALGVITFIWPGVTALALLILIAARAMVVGGLEVAAAIEYRHQIRHEWLLALAGVVSVLFGVGVLVYPAAGALTVIWLIATYAVIVGILQLAFAVSSRPEELPLATGQPPTPA